MSSKAWSTVLFPEPESPVRMTSWRASRLAVCFTWRGRSVFYPALVGAGDAHIFAIFCYGEAGDVNAAAFRAVHRFAEEGAQFEHALRGVRVLAGHRAADGRGMHADFLGDFLDHQGLQSIRTAIEKFALPRDDGLADAQDGVFALLDVFHQLNRGGESFFYVIAHVAIGGIAHQQAAVGGAQAQLRHVVFVQEGLPLIVDFAEIDIRLDQAGLGFVIAEPRARIELLDDIESALYDFERAIQGARDFL